MTAGPERVLLVSTTLDEGGAQRVTSTLLRHMDRSIIRPSLCLLRNRIGFPLGDDVPIHDLEYDGIASVPRTVRRLRRVISETGPDVILSNANATNALTGWAVRDGSVRVPWVARVGNSPARHDRGLRRWAAALTYPHVTCIVSNSRGLAAEMERRFPELTDRLTVIPNPTDLDALRNHANKSCPVSRPDRGHVVVAVGRLYRQKRYDLLLEAIAKVRALGPTELWVCGDGPERARLVALARKLRVDHAVRWLGFLENPHCVVRRADLFVMASDHEGLPNALIEAQAIGIPAVSTRCPHGPDEIIEDGLTGRLVPVGDVDRLSRAIRDLLDDAESRKRMGGAAASTARLRFDARTICRTWESTLRRVAQESR